MTVPIITPIEDQELLKYLSIDELEALANSILVPTKQEQLQELLTKNSESKLSPEETAILDQLLTQIDYLNLIKTRARYTLKYLQNNR
jgi:hypothetical protein